MAELEIFRGKRLVLQRGLERLPVRVGSAVGRCDIVLARVESSKLRTAGGVPPSAQECCVCLDYMDPNIQIVSPPSRVDVVVMYGKDAAVALSRTGPFVYIDTRRHADWSVRIGQYRVVLRLRAPRPLQRTLSMPPLRPTPAAEGILLDFVLRKGTKVMNCTLQTPVHFGSEYGCAVRVTNSRECAPRHFVVMSSEAPGDIRIHNIAGGYGIMKALTWNRMPLESGHPAVVARLPCTGIRFCGIDISISLAQSAPIVDDTKSAPPTIGYEAPYTPEEPVRYFKGIGLDLVKRAATSFPARSVPITPPQDEPLAGGGTQPVDDLEDDLTQPTCPASPNDDSFVPSDLGGSWDIRNTLPRKSVARFGMYRVQSTYPPDTPAGSA